MTAYVQVEHLKKVYSTKEGDLVALEDVTFELERGQFTTIVGQSGCGKTTLLNIVAGLLEKTEGKVIVAGEPVNKPISNVGMVFQSPALLPWRTVIRNTMFTAEILGLDENEYCKKAEDLIKLVRLDGFEQKYPHELSGGMQQRVSLVRALLHDPELLLMDEPFGALDAFTREIMGFELLRIWGEERNLSGRKTIIFVTHDTNEALFLADRIIAMTPRPGRVREIIDVNLPRPRSIELMGSPEYAKLALRIRELVGGIHLRQT